MPTVHLVCGPVGAGKTTYATVLARRARAIRFSIDEWMVLLFLPDRPQTPDLQWAVHRLIRCEEQIWAVSQQLIERDIDVVLDLGLSRAIDRDRLRYRVAQTRGTAKLHYLDVGRETRRLRVLGRTPDEHPGSLGISQAMFDAMEQWFEAPTDDELYGAMIVSED